MKRLSLLIFYQLLRHVPYHSLHQPVFRLVHHVARHHWFQAKLYLQLKQKHQRPFCQRAPFIHLINIPPIHFIVLDHQIISLLLPHIVQQSYQRFHCHLCFHLYNHQFNYRAISHHHNYHHQLLVDCTPSHHLKRPPLIHQIIPPLIRHPNPRHLSLLTPTFLRRYPL